MLVTKGPIQSLLLFFSVPFIWHTPSAAPPILRTSITADETAYCTPADLALFEKFTQKNTMNDGSVYIASVVITYWVVSISMVYLNKVLMSNEGMSIPAPLFVTWYQCVVTVLICWLAGLCGQRARKAEEYAPVSVAENGAQQSTRKPSFFAQFPKTEYLVGQAKQIFPLSLVFGA